MKRFSQLVASKNGLNVSNVYCQFYGYVFEEILVTTPNT